MTNYTHTIIGGLPIAVLDCQQTARMMIEEAIKRRGQEMPCLVHSSANGQVISMCASQPEIKSLFLACDMLNADGMPLVQASRLLTQNPLPERVATTDMFHDAAREAQEKGATFYFLGASEEVNKTTVETIQERYPDLKIVGRKNGYFKREEEPALINEINEAAPDTLWLAMGVPREQQFAMRNKKNLTRVGVIKTSGGLFDFLSGKNSRAPVWMQKYGLEWLYRTWLEPRRLFMRYFLTNPHAIYIMLRQSA